MYAQQRDCTYRIYRLQPKTHISEVFNVKILQALYSQPFYMSRLFIYSP